MKLKLTNKKRAIQIGAFGVILVFVLGLVLNSNFLQAKADMVDVNVDNTIKILEVGPGNLSRLADGIGTYTKTSNGKNYTVTYMSMPEYISGIDDIAGKYDIVAITNKNDNLADKFTDKNVLDTKYTKYSTEFLSEMSNLKYSKNNDDEKDNGYASSGSTLTNEYSGQSNKYVEFYSENDITNKRAKEIVNMAKKGQVVYVENSALIAGSKLESNFKAENSVTKVDAVDIDTLLNAYNTSENKRPEVSNFKVNEDDSKLAYGNKDTRKLKFQFNYDNAPENFTVKVYADYNADGMFKEYNKESGYISELLCSKNLTKSSGSYEVDTSVYSSFVGYLDWKVEIYAGDDTKPKTVVTSSFQFKKLTADKSGAVKLSVLQVYPDVINMFNDDGTFQKRGNYKDVGGLVLSGNGNTNSQKFKQFLDAVQDYDVTVNAMSVTEFNDKCNTDANDASKYDMLIIGFGDSYGGEYDFNNNAMNVIKKYIDDKAIMMSHDTMTLSINRAVTTNANGSGAKGNTKFTNELKGTIGQSRYENDNISYSSTGSYVVNTDGSVTFTIKCTDDGDVYLAGSMFGEGDWGTTKQKMTSLGDNMYEYTIPASQLTKGTTYSYKFVSKGNNFWKDPYSSDTDANGNSCFLYGQEKTAKSLGQTLYAIRSNDEPHGVTRDGANFYEQSKTTTVREVSQAQITEYPYNLSGEGISSGSVDGQNAIRISQTHTQWYQLDLENEEISPWFNLVADGSYFGAMADQFNSGDARNFYYTYSIGNITYSGTGHTSNYTDSELKLFVNTIIRAARGSKITLKLEGKLEGGKGTDINAPIVISDANSDYKVKFNISGKETITDENGRETEVNYADEVNNKYTLAVYNKEGKKVEINTEGFGIGENSGLNPIYTISSNTLKMLRDKEYILGITLTSNIPDEKQNNYDAKVEAAIVTAYVFVDKIEVLSVKHGMAKDVQDLTKWYGKTDYAKEEMDLGTPTVDYYTSVPFEAYITGLKSSTEKTIKLTLDSKFSINDDFKPAVYTVDDNNVLSPVELSEDKITKTTNSNGNVEVTINIGSLQASEILVKYDAKTMAQPEQTTNVDENGINISVGENVTYQNTIEVISETSKSASASVQVGRVVLDRPLF